MRYIDLTKAFLEEANLIDSPDMPITVEIEHWLNEGVNKFVKTRYVGLNSKQQGFEQSQKRIDDLRTLISEDVANLDFNDYYNDVYPHFKVSLPTDYLIHISDTVSIIPNVNNPIPCWPKDDQGVDIPKYGNVIEGTHDTLGQQLGNSLSEHNMHHNSAKPIRIIKDTDVELYTDGTYDVTQYALRYLRRPATISLMTAPTDEYTDLPEHTHSEIVKIAVEMFLENKSNPRVQTYPQQVATME